MLGILLVVVNFSQAMNNNTDLIEKIHSCKKDPNQSFALTRVYIKTPRGVENRGTIVDAPINFTEIANGNYVNIPFFTMSEYKNTLVPVGALIIGTKNTLDGEQLKGAFHGYTLPIIKRTTPEMLYKIIDDLMQSKL